MGILSTLPIGAREDLNLVVRHSANQALKVTSLGLLQFRHVVSDMRYVQISNCKNGDILCLTYPENSLYNSANNKAVNQRLP